MFSQTARNGYCQKLQRQRVCCGRPLQGAQFGRCGLLAGFLNVTKTMYGRQSQCFINATVLSTERLINAQTGEPESGSLGRTGVEEAKFCREPLALSPPRFAFLYSDPQVSAGTTNLESGPH